MANKEKAPETQAVPAATPPVIPANTDSLPPYGSKTDQESAVNFYTQGEGSSVREKEYQELTAGCTVTVPFCCRTQLPRGFYFSGAWPVVCFDLTDLHCIKAPIIKSVTTSTCEPESPLVCDVVVGYAVHLVGTLNYATSVAIRPLVSGGCVQRCETPTATSICCAGMTPVDQIIGYTCDPAPCPPGTRCFTVCATSFCPFTTTDACGTFSIHTGSVSFAYSGCCD